MSVYSMVITLFLVMDPVGNVPLFLIFLRRYSHGKYAWIIIRESIIAWLLLSLFVYVGHDFLESLHISEAALDMAGGLILLLIAIKMIFPGSSGMKMDADSVEEPLIVPLAVPLIAGPSALATVVLLSTHHATELPWIWLSVTLAICIFIMVMLCGRLLRRLLGDRVLTAMERLMGMVLTMIAMQMFLNGLHFVIKGS